MSLYIITITIYTLIIVIIYFNNINKKSRYSYNPIKPYYYKTNYVGIKRTTNIIDFN